MDTLHPSRQLVLELSAEFSALSRLRDHLRAFLTEAGVDDTGLEDVLLVATELCTNAIEATVDREPVEVRVSMDGRALWLSVSNVAAGPGRPADHPDLLHGSLQERGRGLAIVRSLVDTMTTSSAEGRTVVRTMQLV